ncbi:MAG TPA: glycosyl hydrolase family 28-related protein, partial [Magnetospirillaceae bacterium]|nr:glycosyl hydrolase family 28-related protein [Magnetospirillaceae bacterium]
SPGEHAEFTVRSPANALVIRYSLPDSTSGGGIDAGLDLYRNGAFLCTVRLSSRYSWRYGTYPFTGDPAAGKPRNFYDECRLKGVDFAPGDRIRLQKPDDGAAWCMLDLVDLERIAPPLPRPARSLSPVEFGAGGRGETDDTEALRACVAMAAKQGRTVWVPPGDYKLSGEIVLPSHVALQGAGMWHTNFVGDPALYADPERRIRFTLTGSGGRLADFAVLGRLAYRDDKEPNDGIIGRGCERFTLSRLWVEHTKVGMWFYGCLDGVIEACRLRNTRADGVNICTHSRNLTVRNCAARNTGDDCFAVWPAAFDPGSPPLSPPPGSNVFRHCTGELAYLANGAAIYGGAGNRIEDCRFTDMAAGCGVLVSTTFPTADAARGIDYNFSGATVVRGCDLVRCGGYDHEWGWRAAFQICVDRRDISGVELRDASIRDSLSDGFAIIAPGAKKGLGRRAEARLDKVEIPDCGMALSGRHGLWVGSGTEGTLALRRSTIVARLNESDRFAIEETPISR